MIYTTYFSNLANLPDNIVPISICGRAPDWYKGRQYKKLAPKKEFFNIWKNNHNNDYYIEEFNKQVLDGLDAKEVVSELFDGIPEGCAIALVCYEKPNEFCHRKLVAKWLCSHGFEVKEYA